MIQLLTEHPYEGNDNLIKTYAKDDEGNDYYIIQNETGVKYDSAIDVVPLKYSYTPTSEKIETIEDDTKKK